MSCIYCSCQQICSKKCEHTWAVSEDSLMEVVETQLLTSLNQKLLKYPFLHFHQLRWYIQLVKFQQVSRLILLLNPPHSTVEVAFHFLFHIYVSQDIIIVFYHLYTGCLQLCTIIPGYNDISLCDTLSVASDILRSQWIPLC